MATLSYATNDPRIGKFRAEILKHSVPREVLGIVGQQFQFGENQSDTLVFRRWLPFGGAATNATTQNQWVVDPATHQVTEGSPVTPDIITPQDITVQMQQYQCLYMYTDKTAMLYEDDAPAEMKKQTGQRMALLREKIRYGAYKGCTNKFYAGGTSRATVDEVVGLNFVQKITQNLMANRGDFITSVLAPSGNYGTAPVEPGFIVFCHTDCEYDIRQIPGFKQCAEYGQRKQVHMMELGSVNRFRFVVSPELTSIPDAGAAVAGLGLKSTSGTNADIYPMLVFADNAVGDISLRGMNSFQEIWLPHNKADKSDPGGQKGFVGATFWSAAFVQNDGWMAVGEMAVTDI